MLNFEKIDIFTKSKKRPILILPSRRVNNYFGGTPTKKTSCRYVKEQKSISLSSFNSEYKYLKTCPAFSKVQNYLR